MGLFTMTKDHHSVRVLVADYVDLDGSVDAAIEKLENFRRSVPEEFVQTLELSLESDYDSSYANVEVFYWRPETTEERADREQREKEYAERTKIIRRQQYEAMKKEFGDEN